MVVNFLDDSRYIVLTVVSKNGSQLLESQGLNAINITSEGNIDDIHLALKETSLR